MDFLKEKIIEEINKTIHRLDLIDRPYILFTNPANKQICEQCLKQINLYDRYIIKETHAIDRDQIVVMKRENLEKMSLMPIKFE